MAKAHPILHDLTAFLANLPALADLSTACSLFSCVQCVGPLCYDFSRLDDYINQPHVREQLGVGDREWEACNMQVNYDMQGRVIVISRSNPRGPRSLMRHM